jgi:hypothetical protein
MAIRYDNSVESSLETFPGVELWLDANGTLGPTLSGIVQTDREENA